MSLLWNILATKGLKSIHLIYQELTLYFFAPTDLILGFFYSLELQEPYTPVYLFTIDGVYYIHYRGVHMKFEKANFR